MKNRFTLGLNLLTFLFCVVILFFQLTASNSKIAFIRSSDLVNSYIGMKEAQSVYQQKLSTWQTRLDTLKADIEEEKKRSTSSTEETRQQQTNIERMESSYSNYSRTLQQQAAQEEEQLIQGTLNKINSYIQFFAEKHDYDLVVGVLEAGNVLYGNAAIDITDEVLEGLNSEYQGIGKN